MSPRTWPLQQFCLPGISGTQAASGVPALCDRGVFSVRGAPACLPDQDDAETGKPRTRSLAWWLEQAPRQCLCPSSAASTPIAYPPFKPPSCIGSGQAQNASAPSSERSRGEADKASQVCCQDLYFTFLVTSRPWVCWKHGVINETFQWRCSQTASPSLFSSRGYSPRQQTSMHHNPSARSTTTAANGSARDNASGEAEGGIRHPMTVSGEPSVVIRLGIQGRRTGASVVRISSLSQSPT